MGELSKIEARIVASRAKLLAAVEGIDKGAWEWLPDEDRWSVRLRERRTQVEPPRPLWFRYC